MGRGQSVMIRFGTMDWTFYCRDCHRIFNDQLWSWFAFYILPKETVSPVALYLLDVHLAKAWRAVFNTHINFDEIACNNKAALTTAACASQKLSNSLTKELLVAVVIPAKMPTYLKALKVVWEQAQDVPRGFAQCVCECQLKVRDL